MPPLFAAAIVLIGAIQVTLAVVAPEQLHGYPGSVRTKRRAGLAFGTVITIFGIVMLVRSLA